MSVREFTSPILDFDKGSIDEEVHVAIFDEEWLELKVVSFERGKVQTFISPNQ